MNNINEWTFQNLICDNGISKIYKAVKSDGTNSVIKHLRLPIDSNRAMELVNRGKISTVNDSINYYVNVMNQEINILSDKAKLNKEINIMNGKFRACLDKLLKNEFLVCSFREVTGEDIGKQEFSNS